MEKSSVEAVPLLSWMETMSNGMVKTATYVPNWLIV
jgi:hypothetical protein